MQFFFELEAIKKQQTQEELFLPSPFQREEDMNSPCSRDRLINSRGICKLLHQLPQAY